MKHTTYLLLGSNLGERLQSLQDAVEQLQSVDGLTVIDTSSVYETEPVELSDEGGSFLNMVVKAETELDPKTLLDSCETIERDLGRQQKFSKRSRQIDIDILLYGETVVSESDLQIPHARLIDRAFALVPLLELAPELVDPINRSAYSKRLAELSTEGVRKYNV